MIEHRSGLTDKILLPIDFLHTEKEAEQKRLIDQGMPGDVDFQRMIRDFREEHGVEPHAHIPPGDLKICICVRKRPINDKERKRKDYDAVTCFNPVVSQEQAAALQLTE